MPSQFKNIEIQDTGYLTLPSGTSSERPSQPESGMIRYNTDFGETEWYDSDRSDWFPLRDTNQFVSASGGTVVDTEINGRPYRLHYFTNSKISDATQTIFTQDAEQASPNAPDQLFDFTRGQGLTQSDTSQFTIHSGHDGIWPHYAVVKLSNTPVVATEFKWIKHGNAVGNVDFYGSNDDINNQNFTDTTRYDFLGRGHFGGQSSEQDGIVKVAEINSSKNAYKWYLLVVRDGDPTPLSAPNVGELNPYAMYGAAYFNSTGNLSVTAPGEVEYLIVAGGGSGGNGYGGGGGAGGVVSGTTTITPQSYTITVGNGAPSKVVNDNRVTGDNGENSTAFGLTALGGSGGGGQSNPSGLNGGSGGGNAGSAGGNPGVGLQSASASGGFGNNGGAGNGTPGGGGGGAGSAGGDSSGDVAGNGGIGISSLITGPAQFFAGGGGGANTSGAIETQSTSRGLGGIGGGGIGQGRSIFDGTAGAPNTGGGSGGSDGRYFSPSTFPGGSGIVIVRYPRDPDATYSQPDRTISSTLPGNFNIIEDGLILNLDAGDPVSYPGSGSTWRDLGQGTDGTISGAGFSVDNGGYFEFDGSNDVVTGQPTNINSLNESTIILWYRSTLNHNTHNGPFTVFVGNQFIFVETREGRNFFQIATETKSKNVKASSPQAFLINGAWHHIAVSRDGSGNLTGYIDGNSIAFTQEDIYGSWGNPGTSYWLGVQADGGGIYSYHDCDVADFEIYSREMSDQEISHNFNVTRGRFGV